jgi:hypothetical protein
MCILPVPTDARRFSAAQERKHREKQRKFLVAAESKLNVEVSWSFFVTPCRISEGVDRLMQ